MVPLPGTGNAGGAAGWWGGADFRSPLGDFKVLVRHPSAGTQNTVGGPSPAWNYPGIMGTGLVEEADAEAEERVSTEGGLCSAEPSLRADRAGDR